MTVGDELRSKPKAPKTGGALSDIVEAKSPGIAQPASRSKPRGLPAWLRTHRRLSLVVVGLAALGLLIAFFVLPKLSGDGGDLILAPVTRGNIEATVTALGNIQPKNYVDVGAQVSGQIKALHVSIGDHVKKGDLLAQIDAQVQQSRVEADNDNLNALHSQLVDKQAQLLLKQAQYSRQVRLDKEGATSKDDLQTAKAALDSQTAQIEALQSQIKQAQSTLQGDQVTLSYARIIAPMDGTVVSLAARLGQTLNSVQQAPTLLRIADLSLMQIWTQVSEADVSKLKPGMPAYFTTLGNPSRRYEGTLQQILPTPETVNNVILFDVLFDAPNPDGSLMTQMTAQVFFVTAAAKDALLVPAAAVQPMSGRGPGRRGRAGQDQAGEGQASQQQAGRQQAGAGGRADGGGNRAGRRAGAGGEAAPAGAISGSGSGQRGPGGFAATHGMVEVIANGKIERRVVETGVTDRVSTEIKSGLKEGEEVVIGRKQAAGKTAAAPGQAPGGRSPLQGLGPPGGGRGFR